MESLPSIQRRGCSIVTYSLKEGGDSFLLRDGLGSASRAGSTHIPREQQLSYQAGKLWGDE